MCKIAQFTKYKSSRYFIIVNWIIDNILQTKIAKELLKKKVNNIESLKPDFISTGNIGCITQISNGTQTPILHTIEVLDWYTGGPKPKILQKN